VLCPEFDQSPKIGCSILGPNREAYPSYLPSVPILGYLGVIFFTDVLRERSL